MSRIAHALIAFVLFASVAGAAEAAGLSPPPDASEYGHHIDWLINITNFFCAVLFIIMIIWMGMAFMKHGKDHTAEYDHGDAQKQVKKALILSAVIFFIVDGNLWVDSTMDVNGIFWNFEKPQQGDHVKIEINARQWVFEARYAGPDGKFNTQDDALTTNDIRVPKDTPIVLQMASPDVIHAFGLPHFRMKQDATPGMINSMWFQGKEAGKFPITCYQHCGANHYKMAGELTVLERADYEKWLALKVRDSEAVWGEKDTEAHWGWEWKKPK